MSQSDDLKAEARAAAVQDATETKVPRHGPIDDVRVSDPFTHATGITVSVRVVMRDGTEHCYEYRTDLSGAHGSLWPVSC